VEFFGWFENEEHVFIAMEYFPHGTLDLFITDALEEADIQIISKQLIEGLAIMHEEGFTHRDLKPQVSDLKLNEVEI
jgi:calcium/calmodulin-dependent protein kinase I